MVGWWAGGRWAALVACLALAGCGGGGSSGDSDQPETTGDVAVPSGPQGSGATDWVSGSVAHTFDFDRAQRILSSRRFQGVNADLVGGGDNQSHPYALIRLELALSGGWTGLGQRVAVVDDGFRLTHGEFAGTDIKTFGNVAVAGTSSHGTHVAALISGSADSGAMMGVAPDADLHLTSYLRDDNRTGVDITKLAAATAEATSLGAVAQNNSWGILRRGGGSELLLSDVEAHLAANAGSTVSDAFSTLAGGSANGWRRYFDALDDFQDSGVVVWAMSNDESLGENDASSALPLLVPELNDAWIAVGNGLFTVNAQNEIVDAQRLSVACGAMARSCLFADGTTQSAGIASDTSYGMGTGTSFAAPQVSGAIAILAQAFPSLTPEEWTRRLLATAYSDFSDFSPDGTVMIGGAVEKAYSDEWGMGVLDVAAALSPINGVSLVNGRDLASADRSNAETSGLVTGSAYGDGVRAALAGVDVAVFDALDTPFMTSAGNFAMATRPDLRGAAALPEIGEDGLTGALRANGMDSVSAMTGFGAAQYRVAATGLGGGEAITDARGLGSAAANVGAVASLSDTTAAMIGRYEAGAIGFEHFGFVGTHASIENGAVGGVGAALSLDAGAAQVKASVMSAYESGGVLGLSGRGGFAVDGGAVVNALALSGQIELGGATVFAGIEGGVTGAAAGGYFAALEPMAFSSFQMGVSSRDLMAAGDQLTFAVSQPMRLDSGAAVVRLPAGRTLAGAITTADHRVDLAPEGRQIDFGLNYSFAPTETSALSLGAVVSTELGHSVDQAGAAVAARFSQRF